MADACEMFLNSVEDALSSAEAELIDGGANREKVRNALEDVKSVLQPISVRHFERSGFKHKVGDI